MSRLLIVNADDFGLSTAVNEAVEIARRQGTLTSASLMVMAPAAREAVEIARDDPGLAVGLHVVVNAPAFRLYFSEKRRRKALREIEAQFEAFAETGLPLSHVDGHQHLHAHPTVLPTIVLLAEQYGAAGMRIPSDPVWLNLRLDRSRLAYKLPVAAGHAYLAWTCRRALKQTRLVTCPTVIGSLMSGAMRDDYLIEMLKRVESDPVEAFFHPSTEQLAPRDAYGPNPGDLQTLTSPRLKAFLDQSHWTPATYTTLQRAAEATRELA